MQRFRFEVTGRQFWGIGEPRDGRGAGCKLYDGVLDENGSAKRATLLCGLGGSPVDITISPDGSKLIFDLGGIVSELKRLP